MVDQQLDDDVEYDVDDDVSSSTWPLPELDDRPVFPGQNLPGTPRYQTTEPHRFIPLHRPGLFPSC